MGILSQRELYIYLLFLLNLIQFDYFLSVLFVHSSRIMYLTRKALKNVFFWKDVSQYSTSVPVDQKRLNYLIEGGRGSYVFYGSLRGHTVGKKLLTWSQWTVGGAPNLSKFSTNSEATVPASGKEDWLSPLGQISKIILVPIIWALGQANTSHSKGPKVTEGCRGSQGRAPYFSGCKDICPGQFLDVLTPTRLEIWWGCSLESQRAT